MAFPFEQIGLGLRRISLSGGIGNIFAIIIYAAVSLLPAAALLFLRKRRALHAEDTLLALLSAVLFAVLYAMINPGVIASLSGSAVGVPVGKAILGTMVYSMLCGYFVLRILRLFVNSEAARLLRYMSVMLCLLGVLFIYEIFGAGIGSLLDSIAALRAGNTGGEHLLGTSYIFLALRFAVDALPYTLSMLIVFAALRLLGEMQSDRYSAETVAAAGRISRLCALALVITTVSNIAFNLLQLVFVKSLLIVNSSVQIPLFPIAFALAALLLTRLVTENKRLKDDNDMFI